MILNFVSQNLWYGGLRNPEGEPENRWPDLATRIKSAFDTPDFVFLQEVWGWNDYGHRQLALAKKDLKLEAMPLPHAACGNGVAILYNPETVGSWARWDDRYTDLINHGSGFAAFDLGLSSLLTVSSIHLDAFGVDRALHETELIIPRAYRNGPLAVLGGDFNYTSSRSPDPDYTGMRPYNIGLRTELRDDKQLKPDRRVAKRLEQGGYVDVAQYMFDKTQDSKYQAATGNSPSDRIDQFWVTSQLASGIVDYKVLDSPENASDHKGIAFQLDTDIIDDSRNWEFS